MSRRLLTAAVSIGLLATPALAFAQKGQAAADSRPAVMPFGAVGADGAAAMGAGLRLFPAGGSAPVAPAGPGPQTVSVPLAPPAAAPAVKPVAAGAAPGIQPNLPSTKPSPAGAPAAPLRSPTAFTPQADISARVRDQVLNAALPSSPNPEALRGTVNSGLPWTEFNRLLARHGYDPNDLSDVVAAFYLIAWEVATGGDALSQPAGIAAVRGQARQMLATNQAMQRLSEGERQATAETLAFHAMAMAARTQDLRSAGSEPQLVAYRGEVAQAVAQWQGIDLRRFTLTPDGFQEQR